MSLTEPDLIPSRAVHSNPVIREERETARASRFNEVVAEDK